MDLVVDSREPDSVLSLARSHWVGNDVVSKKLGVGDYKVEDGSREVLRVERKTIQDFAQSIQSKRKTGRFANKPRLFAQLSELDRHDPSYLVVVGTISDLEETYEKIDLKVPYETVFGAFASVNVRFDTHMLTVGSNFEALRIMCKIAQKVSEGKRFKGFTGTSKKNVKPRHILSQVTSWRISRRLEREFGSIKNVCDASVDELQGVRGVGPTTAKKIRDKLTSEV